VLNDCLNLMRKSPYDATTRTPHPSEQRLFISYAHKDGKELAQMLASDLSHMGYQVWWDQSRLHGGASWSVGIEQGIDKAQIVLALLSNGSFLSDICRAEQLRALRKQKRVVPILVQRNADRPIHLETKQYIQFDDAAHYHVGLQELLRTLGTQETASLARKYETTYVTTPPLPLHFIPRPSQLKTLMDIVLSDASDSRISVAALRAMGGMGKTVLVQSLCNVQAVQDAFPDGVVWGKIGRQPTNLHLVEQIREIGKALGDNLARYDNLQGCTNQLRTTLRDKAALIVLDDVWDPRDIQSFIADAPRCKLLLTTRQRAVMTATGARECSLGGLESSQASSLLAKWSGTPVQHFPPEADEIIREVGGLPLALSMIGGQVQQGPDAWGRVSRRLRNAELEKIRLQLFDYDVADNVAKVIEMSVERLAPQDRERYLSMAAFRVDAPVSKQVLETFWGAAKDDVAETLEAWIDVSLASFDFDQKIILHDLQTDYVRGQQNNLSALHQKLVDAYRAHCSGVWSSGPDDGYFFTSIAYHLWESGNPEELSNLLASAEWIRLRIARGELDALLSDYEYFKKDPAMHSIVGALRLSAHTLRSDPQALSGQLVGRLGAVDLPRVHQLLESTRQAEGEPWLCPFDASLTAPGGPLVLTMIAGYTNAVSVTKDGKCAVSGDASYFIDVWDLERGISTARLSGHHGSVNTLVISPDGKFVVSGSDDEKLRIWDLTQKGVAHVLEGHTDKINCLALTADGKRAISASDDRTLKLWDLGDRREIYTLCEHSAPVSCVALTPDDKHAISGSEDGTLIMWDLEGRKPVYVRGGLRTLIIGICVSPNGSAAFCACSDNTIKIWDVHKGRVTGSLRGHSDFVQAVSVSSDGKRLISASRDRTLRLWDLETHETVMVLEGHTDNVYSVTVAQNFKRAVSGAADRTLRIWSLEADEFACASKLSATRAVPLMIEGGRKISATFIRSQKMWSLGAQAGISSTSRWGYITAVAAKGNRAVSRPDTHTLRLWDTESDEPIYTIKSPTKEIKDKTVSLSRDGEYLVFGYYNGDIELWDLNRRALVCSFVGNSECGASAVSSDGKHVVAAYDNSELRVWDVDQHKAIWTFSDPEGWFTKLVLTPDLKYVVTGSARYPYLKIWDFVLHEIRHMPGHRGRVNSLALTLDNKYVLSGSDDQTARLWELATGLQIAVFGADSEITLCSTSPDSQMFVVVEKSGQLHYLRLVNAPEGAWQAPG
jgi:WD40 repeat protein